MANDAYEAFGSADKNMDSIRLMTAKVPEHMKSSLEILYNVILAIQILYVYK